VATDLDAVRALLRGRRVLITGAGGSIGSEIARQVAGVEPAQLLLLDHDETHLHDVCAGMSASVAAGRTVQLLADIRDRDVLLRLFERHRPEIVFHAAAHKHVPVLEQYPCEAVRTNVFGTENLIEAATAVGVERFVFISTDKAVNPSCVMGASKNLGEQLMLTAGGLGTKFCAVRFGNVLGSRGSVIPTFVRQVKANGPVTLTHPKMTRFFMSIPEAVQLVLQAAAMCSTGGEIYVLDMGEQVSIYDLAHRMIRLAGRRVGEDIEIRVVGVRPGEKLTEELHTDDEELRATVHPSIRRLVARDVSARRLREGISRLRAHTRDGDDAAVRAEVFRLTRPLLRPLVPAPSPSPAPECPPTGPAVREASTHNHTLEIR
jgi:FlaA1/EpsC-like NDP-sugar epimerase